MYAASNGEETRAWADLAFSAMDTDKIKIFGARVKVDGTGKLAELERAEKVLVIYAGCCGGADQCYRRK